MTYSKALAWALGQGVPEADARWLLQEAARITMAQYLLARDTVMDREAVARYEQLIRRRAAGEPVQHILGYWDFCDLTLKTDRRALIPRPETEILVQEALTRLPEGRRLAVADVGCGSGCIGLALKAKRHRCHVVLMDISEGARALAAENALLTRLAVDILPADMREPLPAAPYDMICSNPPYISTTDCETLDEEVRAHDPLLALDGGADGLDFYRALADRAEDSLAEEGWILLELGIGQAEAVKAIFAPVASCEAVVKDLAGIERVLCLRKDKR